MPYSSASVQTEALKATNVKEAVGSAATSGTENAGKSGSINNVGTIGKHHEYFTGTGDDSGFYGFLRFSWLPYLVLAVFVIILVLVSLI